MNKQVFQFHFYSMFQRMRNIFFPNYGNWRGMAVDVLVWLPAGICAAIGQKKFTQIVLTDTMPILGWWIVIGLLSPLAWSTVVSLLYACFSVYRFRGYETIQRSPGYRAFKMTPQERQFKQYCARHIPKEKERIIASANLDSEGNTWVVMCPGRHHHVIWFMGDYDKNRESRQQGFLTNKFRFLGRQDARKLAMKNGQASEPDHARDLFSEDLWSTPSHLRQSD